MSTETRNKISLLHCPQIMCGFRERKHTSFFLIVLKRGKRRKAVRNNLSWKSLWPAQKDSLLPPSVWVFLLFSKDLQEQEWAREKGGNEVGSLGLSLVNYPPEFLIWKTTNFQDLVNLIAKWVIEKVSGVARANGEGETRLENGRNWGSCGEPGGRECWSDFFQQE